MVVTRLEIRDNINFTLDKFKSAKTKNFVRYKAQRKRTSKTRNKKHETKRFNTIAVYPLRHC